MLPDTNCHKGTINANGACIALDLLLGSIPEPNSLGIYVHPCGISTCILDWSPYASHILSILQTLLNLTVKD